VSLSLCVSSQRAVDTREGGANKLFALSPDSGNEVSRLNPDPEFVHNSRMLEEAYELAVDAHHGARRRSDTDVDHPVAVGMLLHERGFDDEVVAAALLHEVLEDTATEKSEITERFGPGVGELVGVMTEDASIELYEERKAEHRGRIARHSSDAAAIYAADKLASASAIRDHGGPVPERKLRHYRQTQIELSGAHPGLPFLAELEEGLRELEAEQDRVARR
jgi:polyphosphate kinase